MRITDFKKGTVFWTAYVEHDDDGVPQRMVVTKHTVKRIQRKGPYGCPQAVLDKPVFIRRGFRPRPRCEYDLDSALSLHRSTAKSISMYCRHTRKEAVESLKQDCRTAIAAAKRRMSLMRARLLIIGASK